MFTIGSSAAGALKTSSAISLLPILMVALAVSVTGSAIRWPSMKVPFIDPRSSTTTPSGAGRKEAWRRDISLSSIVRSAFSRPTTTSASSSWEVPAAGPDVTLRTLKFEPPLRWPARGEPSPKAGARSTLPQLTDSAT